LSIRFDIISATPQALESYFNTSILKRARERKIIDVQVHNLRDFAEGKYKQIDDKPYGGGAGMVLMPGPILKAVTRIKRQATRKKVKVIVFSAKGKEFNQKMAYELAKKYDQLVMVSGRYEGIDERVIKALNAEEVSIGRYVLTDGDVAAMVVTSAVARLIPGVIRLESLQEESHWNLLLKKEVEGGGLEYPHYTRPEVLKYKGKVHRVPNILLSGNHKKITDWRSSQK
jgi:tRNA (guanine37-N1)-methyltransferase